MFIYKRRIRVTLNKNNITLTSICFFNVKDCDVSQDWGIYFNHSVSYYTLFAALFWVVFFIIIITNYTSIKKYLSNNKIYKFAKEVICAFPITWKFWLLVNMCVFSFNFSYDIVLALYCSLPSINFILPSINFAFPSIDFSTLSYSGLQESFSVYLYAFCGFDHESMVPETYLVGSHFSPISETVCMATSGQGESSDTAPVSHSAAYSSSNFQELDDIARDFYTAREDTKDLVNKAISRLPNPADQTYHRSMIYRTGEEFEGTQFLRIGDNLKGKLIVTHETYLWKLDYTRRNLSSVLDNNDLNQMRLLKEALTNSLKDVKNWRP